MKRVWDTDELVNVWGLTDNELQLLQICLVYINTLMIQQVLAGPTWSSRMKFEDYRALSPLIYKGFEVQWNENVR